MPKPHKRPQAWFTAARWPIGIALTSWDYMWRTTPMRRHEAQAAPPADLAAKLAQRVSGETLSEREIDVLKLMAQGKSNKEIGSALFISEGTVKSHVKAIFAKMNVISRTEAVASATRRGLIQL